MSRVCEHGRQRHHCKPCGGAVICEHRRKRHRCRECKALGIGGSGLCDHDRQRNKCRECKGASICEHNRRRPECRECGGSQVENPRRAQRQSLRRARKQNARREMFSADEWQSVIDFYGGRCAYGCGRAWEHQDHVVPLSRGGAHAIWNVVPACGACNLTKNAQTWEPVTRHPFMLRDYAQA